jgi:hypothetical protein
MRTFDKLHVRSLHLTGVGCSAMLIVKKDRRGTSISYQAVAFPWHVLTDKRRN